MAGAVIDIVGLQVKRRWALTNEGDLIPITNLLDNCGEDVEDPKDAVWAIAGPDRTGVWWRVEISQYQGGTIH